MMGTVFPFHKDAMVRMIAMMKVMSRDAKLSTGRTETRMPILRTFHQDQLMMIFQENSQVYDEKVKDHNP